MEVESETKLLSLPLESFISLCANAEKLLDQEYGYVQSKEACEMAFEAFEQLPELEVAANKAIQSKLSQLMFNYGVCLHQTGQTWRSFKYFQKSFQVDSSQVLSLFNIAKILADSLDFHHALKFYEQFLGLVEGDRDFQEFEKEALMNSGKIYEQIDNFEKAVKIYEKTLQLHPQDSLQILFAKFSALERIKKLNKEYAVHEKLAFILSKCEMVDAALKVCKLAKSHSRTAKILALEGDLLWKTRNYKNANQCYLDSIEINPYQVYPYIQRANLLLNTFITLDPNMIIDFLNNAFRFLTKDFHPFLYQIKGTILAKTFKDPSHALNVFQEWLQLSPSDELPTIMIANVHALFGNYKKAHSYYNSALFLTPSTNKEYRNLAYFNKSLVYEEEGKISQAFELYELCSNDDKDSAERMKMCIETLMTQDCDRTKNNSNLILEKHQHTNLSQLMKWNLPHSISYQNLLTQM